VLNRIAAGYIIFEFEEFDWAHNWKDFLANLKKLIPNSERKYDSKTKLWSIKATKENQMHFRALRKMYFSDLNQEELL